MDRWIDRLISNHKPVLIVLLLITIPFLYYFSKQTYFNHINVFFPKGDPEIKYYEAFQDKFGNDDLAAIVFKTDDIFTSKNIELIRKITAAIKPFVGVQRVTSLTETEVARGSEDTVDFQTLFPLRIISRKSMAHLQAETVPQQPYLRAETMCWIILNWATKPFSNGAFQGTVWRPGFPLHRSSDRPKIRKGSQPIWMTM